MRVPQRLVRLILAHGIPMLAPFFLWLSASDYYPFTSFLQGTGPLGFLLLSLVGDYWLPTCVLFGVVWIAIFYIALFSRACHLGVAWHFGFSTLWVILGVGPVAKFLSMSGI